jgi:hypothetical protein
MGEYLGTAQISFAQIDYYTGSNSTEWGVRVATKGTHPSPGDTVVVYKRNGGCKRVTLGGICHRDNGAFPAPAVYYRTARNGQQRRQPNRSQRIQAQRSSMKQIGLEDLRQQYRETREALRSAEQNLNDYDPADFEWFDGEIEIQRAHEAGLRNAVETLRAKLADIEAQGKRLAGVAA